MKNIKLKKPGMVLAAMMLVTSAHAYNKESALTDCAAAVMNHGHSNYYSMHDTKVADKGYNNYNVTGKLLSKTDKNTHPFKCKIRNREVINWHVQNAHKGSDTDKAVAIGAGILAVAAIAAAANKDTHKDHDKGASVFSDMPYLKRQCRKNIRHHIRVENEPVKKVRLDTARLHNRTLRGIGGVLFKRGGGSDISYSCKFDRNGRIYDGHYDFR